MCEIPHTCHNALIPQSPNHNVLHHALSYLPRVVLELLPLYLSVVRRVGDLEADLDVLVGRVGGVGEVVVGDGQGGTGRQGEARVGVQREF